MEHGRERGLPLWKIKKGEDTIKKSARKGWMLAEIVIIFRGAFIGVIMWKGNGRRDSLSHLRATFRQRGRMAFVKGHKEKKPGCCWGGLLAKRGIFAKPGGEKGRKKSGRGKVGRGG